MSAILISGLSGSGKTSLVYDMIIDSLNSGRLVYTNIEIFIDHPNLIYFDELTFKDFIRYINSTFSDVSNFEEKKKEINVSQYYDCDFFIDEAYFLGFDRESPVLLNWLSLHRHFSQNIVFSVQSILQFSLVYRSFFHPYIEIVSPADRLFFYLISYRVFDSFKGRFICTRYLFPFDFDFSSLGFFRRIFYRFLSRFV